MGKEQKIWAVSIGALVVASIAAIAFMYVADLHYAFKAFFEFGYLALASLIAFIGLIVLCVRVGFFRLKNLYFVATAGFLIFVSFLGLNSASNHRKPSGLAKNIVEAGWQLFDAHKLDAAEAKFDEAIIADPNFSPGYFGKAYILSIENKLDPAIDNYKKSIELDPTHVDGYSNLGLALLYKGALAEALAAFRKGEALDPENGDLQVNMATYYFQTRDFKSSWNHLKHARRLNARINPGLIHDLTEKMAEPVGQ